MGPICLELLRRPLRDQFPGFWKTVGCNAVRSILDYSISVHLNEMDANWATNQFFGPAGSLSERSTSRSK